jgi:hypothetical protein
MAPRYHSTKTVKSNGYNKYNGGKGFEDHDSPLIVHKDFYNQYKRNIDLTNKDYKINTDPNDFHKLNEIGLERAYTSPDYLYKIMTLYIWVEHKQLVTCGTI